MGRTADPSGLDGLRRGVFLRSGGKPCQYGAHTIYLGFPVRYSHHRICTGLSGGYRVLRPGHHPCAQGRRGRLPPVLRACLPHLRQMQAQACGPACPAVSNAIWRAPAAHAAPLSSPIRPRMPIRPPLPSMPLQRPPSSPSPSIRSSSPRALDRTVLPSEKLCKIYIDPRLERGLS